MNPRIRKDIIKAYDSQNLWMEDNLPASLKREKGINEGDTFKTMQLMKDCGELVPYGSNGALRLSLKLVESQASFWVRSKKYMYDNWPLILGLLLNFAGTIILLFQGMKK